MGFIFTQDDFYLEFRREETLPEDLRQWYLEFLKDKESREIYEYFS